MGGLLAGGGGGGGGGQRACWDLPTPMPYFYGRTYHFTFFI